MASTANEFGGRTYEKAGSLAAGAALESLHQPLRDLAAERRRRRPRGRPRRTAEHEHWAKTFRKLRDELNDGFEPVDGERPLNNMEISQLVVDKLGLPVTKHAVWNAVKDRV